MEVDWTEEEIEATCAVLKRIELYQNDGRWLPPKLFEAHVRTFKRLSTELIVAHNYGQEVYLVRRPTSQDSPHDPYADKLHFPGVTHGKWETTAETFDRLREQEGVAFNEPKLIAERETDGDSRGSRCLMRIFLAQQAGEMTNPRGAWYPISQIPERMLVASHRTLILPALRAHLASSKQEYPGW